jgi:hypothetical protein
MISKTSGLMKYLGLMIGATYILSVGSVYAQNNQTGQTGQDVTGPILAQALKSLMNAKQAYDSGNKTGALDEIHQSMWYLQMIGLPKNCVIDKNQMLQCNFPR